MLTLRWSIPKRTQEGWKALEMSQSAARGCQEWGQADLIEPLWVGGKEEVTAPGFVFAISPACHSIRGDMDMAGDWCQDPLRGCTHRCTNPPWWGQGAEAQPGEKARDQGTPPNTPRSAGGISSRGLVIGAVRGASWDAPGDPYKGLRGAGGFYSL